jgi:tetratricopeptide (TPR) repeat protein
VAINKSNTPIWMKVTLIILSIVFVLGFVSIGASPFISQPSQTNTQTGADPLTTINQKYQPTVAAVTSALQSDPASYTALVTLGNTYFDWAIEIQQQSQTTSAAVGADQPLWVSAKDAYARAYAINQKDSPAAIDYSIAVYYSGDTSMAVSLAEDVIKRDPQFPPAYFNVGLYYESLGRTADAIKALERYIALDPNGQQGNLAFAKERLAALKAGGSGATTVTP